MIAAALLATLAAVVPADTVRIGNTRITLRFDGANGALVIPRWMGRLAREPKSVLYDSAGKGDTNFNNDFLNGIGSPVIRPENTWANCIVHSTSGWRSRSTSVVAARSASLLRRSTSSTGTTMRRGTAPA